MMGDFNQLPTFSETKLYMPNKDEDIIDDDKLEEIGDDLDKL
jgi:hypothetical protein